MNGALAQLRADRARLLELDRMERGGQPAFGVFASDPRATMRELDDLRELAGARAQQARDPIGAQVGELARDAEDELGSLSVGRSATLPTTSTGVSTPPRARIAILHRRELVALDVDRRPRRARASESRDRARA